MVDVSTEPSSLLLPDPERRERKYTIISPDDHVLEPPNLFTGRVEKKFQDRAPRVIELEDGTEAWLYDGKILHQVGFNARAGRLRRPDAKDDGLDPIRFSEMRASAYDIHARIKDMDLDGVYAQLCFPSFLTGFGGIRLQTTTDDQELALALVRAWNDWQVEEWAGTYPGRIIANQITWLFDPQIAAEEIRRNAARGCHAVTFPENPAVAGLPSLHSGYWDPFIEACAETKTVISVHVGSSGKVINSQLGTDQPQDAMSVAVGAGYSLQATVDWLYSKYPARFPELRIVISEGGIGWVPSLLDRLDHFRRHNADRGEWVNYDDITPTEMVQRNFWFCLMDEPSAMGNIDRIGREHVMFETDFPHADSSWPDSQELLHKHLDGREPDLVRKISWENAANLFSQEVPEAIQNDPNAY